jgi:hypothetical protein
MPNAVPKTDAANLRNDARGRLESAAAARGSSLPQAASDLCKTNRYD